MTKLKNKDGLEVHCTSCHEDHDSGWAPISECWDIPTDGSDTPKNKRYCCCSQRLIADFSVSAKVS